MWICHECGSKYGRPRTGCSTFHEGLCEWCEQVAAVTEDRNYGYPERITQDDREKTNGG